MSRSSYVSVTPEQIALLQLKECAAQLELARNEPIRLVQAAKSIHLALLAALTAAVAGSSGIGAYRPNLREQWRQFLESNREPVVEVGLGHRVMQLQELLDRACEAGGIEWLQEPLSCSPEERELLERLVFIRGEFEHPKPILNSFEPDWVLQTFVPACRLTMEALEAVHHHLEETGLDEASQLIQTIRNRVQCA